MKGAPQWEIDVSTIDEQVSIKSIPDASISINTQILDERKVEAELSKHNEGF
jgi:hypothetical protein